MSAPGKRSFFTDFGRKRDLWWQFTVRAIEMRHRGSYLGMAWAVLNPLLMLGLYVIVFGMIFGGRFNMLVHETSADYALAVFLGLILYHLTAESLAMAPTIIVGNTNLVKKVVFPLEVLPLAQLGAFWFPLAVSLGLLLIGTVWFGRGLTWAGFAWLPMILIPMLLLSMGLCWLFSALGAFFRDLTQVMPFVTQIILYGSAIFYPIAKIPPAIWVFLKWNPLLHSVEQARRAVLWDLPVSLPHVLYTWLAGLMVAGVGLWLFKKFQPAFADVV